MDTENKRIQLIELPWDSEASYCPYCTRKVMDFSLDVDDGSNLNPCPHTLFIATDYGFEHTSDWFESFIEAETIYSESDESIDELTDNICLPNAVKFARYQPAPSFFGEYFGFLDPAHEPRWPN